MPIDKENVDGAWSWSQYVPQVSHAITCSFTFESRICWLETQCNATRSFASVRFLCVLSLLQPSFCPFSCSSQLFLNRIIEQKKSFVGGCCLKGIVGGSSLKRTRLYARMDYILVT